MSVVLRNITLSLQQQEAQLPSIVARRLQIPREEVTELRILRKSIDCRKGRVPRFVYSVAFSLPEKREQKLLARRRPLVTPHKEPSFPSVYPVEGLKKRDRPVIIGSGPAGLFAAYRLVQGGCPPLLIERGLPVTERSKQWYAFLKGEEFDSESNLLYGEGGAGTYSDGKLYTRVSDVRAPEVLRIFASAGAPPEILYDSHPHIGSNLLPSIVRRLRERLIEKGAEFRFSTQLTDLVVEAGKEDRRRVTGIITEPGGALAADTVFLACGHSARDTFQMLRERGVALEQKPFQMGVRVEHPQELIDRIQYGGAAGHAALPPAEYQLVVKREEGNVFSFCMCPGGEILPATERAGFICVNGASRHKRIGPFANSGFVVSLDPDHFPPGGDPLAGVRMQEEVEAAAARLVSQPFAVPGLRLPDFIAGEISSSLPDSSYPLAVVPAPFDEFLPPFVIGAVRDALGELGRRLPGFLTPEALVVGPESRSSSPVRMTRDRVDLQSVNTEGLYPMGEGAGFAGGILSAAIDGMRCAEAWLARVGL